jgi:hypothetical protein
MSFERARPIAEAILYEGYALYPYRASSVKNQRRWMFGSLLPRTFSEAERGREPFAMRCVCLLEADADAEIEARARFLHVEARAASERSAPPWEEGAAEEVRSGPLKLRALLAGPHRQRFSVAAQRTLGADLIARERRALEGELSLTVELIRPGIQRLIVSVTNLSPLPIGADAEAARLSALTSTHALLAVRGGAFVSLIDPPEALAELAASCRNSGAWPVLVGEPGERDLVLCSPIILDDHPRVAPESPGDLFDGTEMDEMLTLRILTLTAPERDEAARLDPRVRALLARTEALGPDELARLHGAIRSLDGGTGARRPPRSLQVGARAIGPGDRVRLRPSGRSDIFDLALAGMSATVATIEQDYEDRLFVTVTIDDDPGRDLGARGLPGHRFFFRPDEIEPIEAEEQR